MKLLMQRSAMGFMLMLLASATMGCHNHDMKMFDVNIRLSDKLLQHVETRGKDAKYPNIDVDIVGVPSNRFSYWSTNVKMSEYWDQTNDGQPKEPRASASSFRINFENGTTGALRLAKEDPIWNKWKDEGVMYLFVLSSYPRTGENADGENDTRRAIISLDSDRWDKNTDHVDVVIDKDRITLVSTPKPDKN